MRLTGHALNPLLEPYGLKTENNHILNTYAFL